MVGRDVVPRAALLVEPEPPLALLPEVVLPPHRADRAHPREAVEHHRDERPVAQAGERARVDRLEEPARLGRREHRRRARRHHVRRPPDGRRRVHRENLADDEPVAEHADGRQVLLDGGRRPGVGPDVGRRVSRSRSRVSSWRMASGTARSHRGVAGIGERRVGYTPGGACDVGRCTARMLGSRLVDGRLLVKIRSWGGAGRGEDPIKGVMGRRAQATNPAPAPGAAARTTGGRSQAPARTRTGPRP